MPKGIKFTPTTSTEDEMQLNMLHSFVLRNMMCDEYSLDVPNNSLNKSEEVCIAEDKSSKTNKKDFNTNREKGSIDDILFSLEREFVKNYLESKKQKSKNKKMEVDSKPSLTNNEECLQAQRTNESKDVKNKNKNEVFNTETQEQASTDDKMPDTTENNDEEKALKKRLKRQRQKGKKKNTESKEAEVESNADSTLNADSISDEIKTRKDHSKVSTTHNKQYKNGIKEEDQKDENNVTENADESIENLEFMENVPAFISTALKGKQIKGLKQTKETTTTKNLNNLQASYNKTTECDNDENHEQFTYVTASVIIF